MFSKLFGCFKNGKSFRFPEMDDTNVSTPRAVGQSPPILEAEEVRTGVFRQMLKIRRRTKHEEILLYEKRYLKKYLRHQNIYVSGMTVPEMRRAKRLLLEPENRKDFCLHCCHCFDCYCGADPKKAATDGNVEQVTVDGMVQAAVQSKESEGGECSEAMTATTVKEERGSDENQDTPAKEKVDDEDLSVSESKEEKEPSAMTMASVEKEKSLGAESCVMENIESAQIPSVLESTEGVDGECPISTMTETMDCDSQETTSKKNCELQLEAKQTPMTRDGTEPFAKEKVQSKSDEEPLKEAYEGKGSITTDVACGDNQEITAKKNCEQQSVEDPLKPTTGGESKGSESSEAKLTTVPGDDLEQLAKEKVEIYAMVDSQETTPKMKYKTDEKIQLQQSSEEPLQQSTGDGKEGEECSEARKTTVPVDDLEPPAKEKLGCDEKIPAQSVEKQSKETNGDESAEGKLIIDKTGKMTPEEIVRNNELHSIVLKWFESQEEVLSFIGGSDDGHTYVSLEQPKP